MYQMIIMIMFYNHVIRYRKNPDFLGIQILMRTFNSREKSQNKGGGIPTDMFIAQQLKAIES